MYFYFKSPLDSKIYRSEILNSAESAAGSVNFFDFFGNSLKSYSLGEAQSFEKNNINLPPKEFSLSSSVSEQESISRSFTELQGEFAKGSLEKAVLFSRSKLKRSDLSSEQWLNSWLSSPSSYGIFLDLENDFYLGLSPEILFQKESMLIESFALAGTRALDSSFSESEFLNNPKDIKEHNLVVLDLKSKLEKIGVVETGSTYVERLKSLAHLKTNIKCRLNREMSGEDLIHKLHPSAALGAYPSDHNCQWYENYLKDFDLGRMAAPVLIEFGNFSYCVLGIRSIFGETDDLQLCAGAGIIKESDLASEIQEIKNKKESVLKGLGLKWME